MKKVLQLLVIFCLWAGVQGMALADAVQLIRFSHVVASDTPKGQAAARFAQLVQERSGGKLRVEVSPNGQLYGDQDEIAALQMGKVEIVAPALTKLKVLHIPEFEAFDLPFLFSDTQAVHRVLQGSAGRTLLARLDQQGVVGLAFWDNGFKQMSANRPLHIPADFHGLQMRTQPSSLLDAQMRALGARSRALPFGDVLTALRTGLVDGTEGPVSNFYTQHLQTVQKYLTLSNHGYLGYAVVANKKFWNGLTPPMRTLLEEAMRDATAYANESSERNNAQALEALRQTGATQIIELTAADRDAWRAALAKVHQQAQGRIPKDTLEAIYRDAGYTTPLVSMK